MPLAVSCLRERQPAREKFFDPGNKTCGLGRGATISLTEEFPLMPTFLNQELGFDEVRWSTLRKTSYDAQLSFKSRPVKVLLLAGTLLYRLVTLVGSRPFDGVWWMPKETMDELHKDANAAKHGGGRLFRNYVAQYMALPSGAFQLSIDEIELTRNVYAWAGRSAALFDRPGGLRQIYLPNLAERGNPTNSLHARRVRTYWLKF